MKYLLIIVVFWGIYYYASQRYHFHDALAFAKSNPQASWAPTVDYYVGTAYYMRNEHAKSEEAFTQLLTDYPTCQYAPKALVKLDDSAEENRHWEIARDALKRYVEDYPDGPDIQWARKRLEMLNYSHP